MQSYLDQDLIGDHPIPPDDPFSTTRCILYPDFDAPAGGEQRQLSALRDSELPDHHLSRSRKHDIGEYVWIQERMITCQLSMGISSVLQHHTVGLAIARCYSLSSV